MSGKQSVVSGRRMSWDKKKTKANIEIEDMECVVGGGRSTDWSGGMTKEKVGIKRKADILSIEHCVIRSWETLTGLSDKNRKGKVHSIS